MPVPQIRRSFQILASTLAVGAGIIVAFQHDASPLPTRQPTAAATPEPTPTPSPVPTPVPTPASGEAMPTSDLADWQMVFSDDFNTPVAMGQFPAAVSSKWSAYPSGWTDTSRNGRYAPQVVSVHDGMMDIYLHTEAGVHLVAAPVPVIPGATTWNDQLYGRYAVRFRADPVPGYKTAWLLWPKSNTWPRDGEIDFPEGNLNSTISAFMHRQGATTGSDQDHYRTNARYPDWHTAVVEWAPGRVQFFLDGVSIGKSTTRVPNTPMHWVLQTETAIDGSSVPDDAEGHVYIDWVAIWSYAP